jgi:prolyl-tRNA editing enzyme YbaK/EbsC (Cys-tRNA(Pro) deacylase)
MPEHTTTPATDRFVARALELGLEPQITVLPAGTRTAPEAARAVGSDIGAIVRSLVFIADGVAVLALVSGSRRADESAVAAAVGAGEARRATVAESEGATGFTVANTPPFGHDGTGLGATVCDPALLQHDVVWASAGSHDRVFPLSPFELLQMSGARIADVAS